MEYHEESEQVDLKSADSNLEKHNRRRNKDKKYSKKKTSIINIPLIIMFILLIIIILIFVFNMILKKERKYFEDIIIQLNEEREKLLKNNSLLISEKEQYKNESIHIMNKLSNKKKNIDIEGNQDKDYKIVTISYGDAKYSKQLEYNGKSAFEIAKADEFYGYTPDDIDKDFKKKNEYILSKGRGNGYWLWKPYFLYRTLTEKLNYGDYLIYSDAAIIYVDLAQKLVDFLNERNVDMYLHRLPHLEKQYTKRDAFILLGVDAPFYAETGQFNAAFQIYRKTKFTEFFIREYLYYAQDKRIITDDDNEMGVDNYEGFRDHRHDQSILSLLTKKYGQVNANKTNLDLNLVKNFSEIMPTIFCHYRQRGVSDYEGVKSMCKDVRGNML